MTDTRRAAQGAPCWVSLLTDDLEAAQDFYGRLLGWRYRPGSQKLGPYTVALADGHPVAGFSPASPPSGVIARFPVAWTAYFAADSADAVAQRVRERGGTVAVGPVGFGSGRVAWAADPMGATFGIWEGEVGSHWRAGDANTTPAWLELLTRDAFAAALFYGEVFAWDRGDPGRYEVRFEHDRVILRIDGRTVAALSSGSVESAPDPRVRAYWHVHFCVPDVDAAAARAADLGGALITHPRDSPSGRMAVVRDPQGALFSLQSPLPSGS